VLYLQDAALVQQREEEGRSRCSWRQAGRRGPRGRAGGRQPEQAVDTQWLTRYVPVGKQLQQGQLALHGCPSTLLPLLNSINL